MRSIHGLRVWDLAPDSDIKGENQTPRLPADAVVMAATAKWIALGLKSGQIEVLDGESFKPVARLGGHRGMVNQLRIVDDTLFSVGEDGTMRVWKLTKAVWSTEDAATVWPGDFVWKESSTAAFGEALPDSQFRLFNSAHRGSATSVHQAPAINRIASTGRDGVVRIWDMSAERILLTLQGFGDWGEAIAFDRTGMFLGASFFTPGRDESWHVVWRAMPYRREELGFLGADWRTAFQQWKEREFRLWWRSTRVNK
jgi:WD40 repeat protein